MDIVILTPIPVEYAITRRFIDKLKIQSFKGFSCETGQFEGKNHTYQIAIREIGSRETATAIATQEVIDQLHPSILVLLGICGGVKDVAVGDVVVGTKAYGYEAGKETDKGFVARPQAYHYDRELIEVAKLLMYHSDWKQRSSVSANAKVIFGPIASGNKVIASTTSPIYQQLKLHYNDTTAIEMEAAGFAEAALKHRSVRILNVRGVSDLLDGKSHSDAAGNQEKAVENAAAFTFEFLYQLDFERYKLMVMNSKALATEVQKQLHELIQNSNEPTTNPLFQAISKMIPEATKDLTDDPNDEDSQAALRMALKKKLNNQPDLKQQLLELIKDTKGNQTIVGNENVTANGNFSAGGNIQIGNTTTTTNNYGHHFNITDSNPNIHIGDIINVHLNRAVTEAVVAPTPAKVNEIKTLISKGKMERAIDLMLGYSKGKDSELFNEVILIARQWEALQRETRMGIISFDDKFMTSNRISFSLLSAADRL